MAWDKVWEDIFASREWGKYPPVSLISFVARNFYSVPDRGEIKILEVGCGPGANLWYIAREGFQAYGVDGSETAIELAGKRLDAECPGWRGELKVGDMTRLPFPDNTFDLVFDCEAIYANSWTDSRKIYAEMYRVARPGGKMLTMTFAKGCWGDGTGTRLGDNEWLVAEGPIQGHGLARFTDLKQIPELISPWKLLQVDEYSRSAGGVENGHFVREWVIEAEKN